MNGLMGLLTLSFLGAAAQPLAPPGPPLPAEQVLRQFDRDGDGKIGRAEAPPRMQQRWNQIDTDGDGFATLDELRARDVRLSGTGNGGAGSAPGPRLPEATIFAIPGTRAYVNAAAVAGPRDGKSWATAFATIQEALATRSAEIWVAAGTYTLGAARDDSFRLLTGGALRGGFAGTEAALEERDWERNRTVLNGNGAYHVVTGADGAVLDGFTIMGGDGLGSAPGVGGATGSGRRPLHTTPQAVMGGAGPGSGGGMINYQVAPVVRNCIFEGNRAGKGGAVYNMTSTAFPPRPDANPKTPYFIHCTFRSNYAVGRGGGVANDLGTAPVFMDCVFEGNQTPQKGGGMYNDFGSSPLLINCLFTGNSADSAGGMGNDGGSCPVLYYCTFTRNHAVSWGAPLYQGTGPASNPSLVACVIADNTCDWEDPGIYNWHDNSPIVVPSADGDAGYKPGRFTEAQLPQLVASLAQYRALPAREEFPKPPESVPFSQRIVYVDAGHTGPGDGRSWDSAYASLSAALEDAGRDGAEVRVAAGIYRPGPERTGAFALRPGIRLFGGYKGDERDPVAHATVLDGNHAYHVLIGANGTTVDGFTITGGWADGTGYDGKGGGLVTYERGPQGRPNSPMVTGFAMTVSHCVFAGNYARDGGAVYSYDRARPVFTDCTFVGNRAENGGAVVDRVGVQSTFKGCEFIDNAAHWRGGALYFDYGSRPQIRSCAFRGNRTDGHGGAIFSVSRASQLENTVVTLSACRFEGNFAGGYGGAAALCDNSLGTFQGCSFEGNRAGRAGDDVYTDGTSSAAGAATAAATLLCGGILPGRRFPLYGLQDVGRS